ncbi:MAG: GTP-binding protein [Myxococcus sp.]|nr:GTP-binding protein [Myxococcus sp.]
MTTPFHLLTGFLGAGKTTLLDKLLRTGGERVAVLINEAGAVSLDDHLVTAVDGDVSVLTSGCICCTVRSELAEALERTLEHGPDRVVLETTGLATPAPIVHVLHTHPRLSRALRLEGVVTVVDALRGLTLLEEQPEVREQLELADRVVLTRLDVATGDQVAALRERLAADFPAAEVLEARFGEVARERLLAPATTRRLGDEAAAERWLKSSTPGHDVSSLVLELPESVDAEALELWLRLVTQLDGPKLLRIKGLVQRRSDGAWVVLQAAQHAVSAPRALEAPPKGWRGSRLVVHARGLPQGALEALAASARSAAAGARAVTS